MNGRHRATLFAGAVALLTSGCFVEGSIGGYGLVRQGEVRPAWSFGMAAGFYVDPGPVRVQLGGGGDILVDDEDGPGESMHAAVGSTARVDVTVARLGEDDDPGAVQVRVTAAGAGPGLVLRQDLGDWGESGWAGMAYTGVTIGLFLENFSLSASLGPGFVFSESPALGFAFASGPQLRLTATWVPGGFGAVFLSGFDAEASAAAMERDRFRNQREGQRLQEQRQQQQQQFRRDRCRSQGGHYCY